MLFTHYVNSDSLLLRTEGGALYMDVTPNRRGTIFHPKYPLFVA
jgi:hypothetical protein